VFWAIFHYNPTMPTGRSYLSNHLKPTDAWTLQFDAIDQIWAQGSELGVKEARPLILQASQQPFGPRRLLVITAADQLSEPVQNTLLKLIEEPPEFLAVVLIAPHADSLLPTVRSRLHALKASDEPEVAAEALPAGFLENLEVSRKLIAGLKDRDSFIALLRRALRVERAKMLAGGPAVTRHVASVELLDRAVRRLEQNANQKLVADALLLNWPFQSSTA
jgi:hypothetical protein